MPSVRIGRADDTEGLGVPKRASEWTVFKVAARPPVNLYDRNGQQARDDPADQ
jgi:hypothetical protein